MTRVFRARWVLPISQPPIRDGWVLVDDGRIVAVGESGSLPPQPSAAHDTSEKAPGAASRDAGATVAILPGLVNAHTHLELSYLHEQIPPAPSFGAWVRSVMNARKKYPDPAHPDIVEPARRAIEEARAAGTALFGDISNTLVTVPLLREAGMPAHVFYELLGFMQRDPAAQVRDARARIDAIGDPQGRIRLSLAPHAPYSVSPELFRAIRSDVHRHSSVSSVHLGETPEEVELLRHGTGEIRAVLEELGRWPDHWEPPRVGPVEYLAGLDFIDSRVLAVHGVQFDLADLAHLRARGTTLVSCPRSNAYVGVGAPPLASFYDAGVPVAFGTDSLASVGDLNLFAELREARRIAPSVPASHLLASATLVGAEALGFGTELGSIEPGKRAALIAVAVGDQVTDVEEYLVSESRLDVKWLGDR